MNVKISSGNSKMGAIPSVSLPAGVTCRQDCECSKKCYAKRLERMRPSVHQAYQHNYDLLTHDSDTYWREVEASIMMSRFFRFHVSGDIPDTAYFEHMVDIARTNTHCEILCFIKKYDIVNSHINIIGKLPLRWLIHTTSPRLMFVTETAARRLVKMPNCVAATVPNVQLRTMVVGQQSTANKSCLTNIKGVKRNEI